MDCHCHADPLVNNRSISTSVPDLSVFDLSVPDHALHSVVLCSCNDQPCKHVIIGGGDRGRGYVLSIFRSMSCR